MFRIKIEGRDMTLLNDVHQKDYLHMCEGNVCVKNKGKTSGKLRKTG